MATLQEMEPFKLVTKFVMYQMIPRMVAVFIISIEMVLNHHTLMVAQSLDTSLMVSQSLMTEKRVQLLKLLEATDMLQ